MIDCNSLPQYKSTIPLIVGVVVGVIAAALIAIGIILAIVVMVRRRKRGDAEMMSNENAMDFDNPVYSGMLVFGNAYNVYVQKRCSYICSYVLQISSLVTISIGNQ